MLMFFKTFYVPPDPSLISICRDASSYTQKYIKRSPTKQLYNMLDNSKAGFINLEAIDKQTDKDPAFVEYKDEVFRGVLNLVQRIKKIKKMHIGNCEEYCLLVLDYFSEKIINATLSENIDAYRAEISGTEGIDHSVIVVNNKIIIDPLWNRVYIKKEDYSGVNVPVLDCNHSINGPRLYYVKFNENLHAFDETYTLRDVLELKRENTSCSACC